MTPIGNILGGIDFVVTLLVAMFRVLTGPQNAAGWYFNLGLFVLAPGGAWLAAKVLDWRSSRQKVRHRI